MRKWKSGVRGQRGDGGTECAGLADHSEALTILSEGDGEALESLGQRIGLVRLCQCVE